MTLNECLEPLLKQGCKRITFYVNDHMQAGVAVDQMVTGQSGYSKITHEHLAHDHESALKEVQKSVEKCGELQSKIVKLNSN